MRVFLDANILVSSFSFDRVTRRLVEHLIGGHELLVSEQVMEEFRRVSTVKIKANPNMIDGFIEEFLNIAEVISPPFELQYTVAIQQIFPFYLLQSKVEPMFSQPETRTCWILSLRHFLF